jgi:hypothetical protein
VQFLVESSSEVAVEYTVIVTMPSDGGDYSWLDVKLGGASPTTSGGGEYVFSGLAPMAAGITNTVNHSLVFTIKPDFKGAPPAELKNITNKAQITVHAQQID